MSKYSRLLRPSSSHAIYKLGPIRPQNIFACTYIIHIQVHTHTHTHTYIYAYI